MKMRNRYRKSTALRCDAGSRCLISVVIGSLMGCILLLNLYSAIRPADEIGQHIHLRTSHHLHFPELEEVEEENIQIPPPRKRSPRATKRRPKKTTTLIDEFLDEDSQIRHKFFPDQKTSIDPMITGNDSMFYYPGRVWLDTEGNPIQAHGGGVLFDERSGTYYWYGEYKDGPTYHAHKKGAARVKAILYLHFLYC
ncbi:Glycosyl hydrolase family protein 43 isoform 2 [Cucumis melo var. makuwa]|uniref:Glycosyl hydrolase family protein 43 isoform 2 n=1 Tax=Cucumis melo var. makuwa TaxID=1194695 RepID=A0A5A7TSK3_CUCMM|nr:Glycosyl hydrolase family protein 43 isoform 2 [Cucumis melo var. makuwa]TYJ99445.1 Glycosyl hydrolase family protein 43 isoform 2 [Cucumis melo var. makuwa]